MVAGVRVANVFKVSMITIRVMLLIFKKLIKTMTGTSLNHQLRAQL